MKMMIYGCEASRAYRSLRVLSGGYDEKRGKAILVVQDDDGFGGTIEFDATEARDVAKTLTVGLPDFKSVAGNGIDATKLLHTRQAAVDPQATGNGGAKP